MRERESPAVSDDQIGVSLLTCYSNLLVAELQCSELCPTRDSWAAVPGQRGPGSLVAGCWGSVAGTPAPGHFGAGRGALLQTFDVYSPSSGTRLTLQHE